MSTIKNLESLSSKELVELFNKYSDKPVKKFADRATALKRVAAILPVKSEPKVKRERVTYRKQEDAIAAAQEWSARSFNKKAVCKVGDGFQVMSQMTQRRYGYEVVVRA